MLADNAGSMTLTAWNDGHRIGSGTHAAGVTSDGIAEL